MALEILFKERQSGEALRSWCGHESFIIFCNTSTTPQEPSPSDPSHTLCSGGGSRSSVVVVVVVVAPDFYISMPCCLLRLLCHRLVSFVIIVKRTLNTRQQRLFSHTRIFLGGLVHRRSSFIVTWRFLRYTSCDH